MSGSVKKFADLTEREVLAVAISSEEEDSRIYMAFAEDLAGRKKIASAALFRPDEAVPAHKPG